MTAEEFFQRLNDLGVAFRKERIENNALHNDVEQLRKLTENCSNADIQSAIKDVQKVAAARLVEKKVAEEGRDAAVAECNRLKTQVAELANKMRNLQQKIVSEAKDN